MNLELAFRDIEATRGRVDALLAASERHDEHIKGLIQALNGCFASWKFKTSG